MKAHHLHTKPDSALFAILGSFGWAGCVRIRPRTIPIELIPLNIAHLPGWWSKSGAGLRKPFGGGSLLRLSFNENATWVNNELVSKARPSGKGLSCNHLAKELPGALIIRINSESELGKQNPNRWLSHFNSYQVFHLYKTRSLFPVTIPSISSM